MTEHQLFALIAASPFLAASAALAIGFLTIGGEQ